MRPKMQRRTDQRTTSNDRGGFTLLEMFVAVVVLGTLLATFLPLMQSVGYQQRLTDQRLLALREAENLLEILTPRPWNELTQEFAESQSLSDEAKSRLPQGTLDIDVTQPTEPADSKKVTVQVIWTPRPGQAAHKVQLAAWFFRTEGQP